MKRQFMILNVGLFLLLAVAGLKFRTDWLNFGVSQDVDRVQFGGDAVSPPVFTATGGATALQTWTDIADQNLFSFDRNDISIAIAEGPVVVGPRPILLGTVSLGSGPLAMLAVGEQGNREYRSVRVGEVVDGWELIEIEGKAVVIESGGVRSTIIMNDPTAAQIPRDRRRTIARNGAGPQVSTVQTAQTPPPGAGTQSSVNRSPARLAAPNPANIMEENVPPGFMIQRTPFGNRFIPKPQP